MNVIAVPFVEREQPTYPGQSLTEVSFIVPFLQNCNQNGKARRREDAGEKKAHISRPPSCGTQIPAQG